MPSDELRRAAIQKHINAAKHLGEDTPVVVPIRREYLKTLDMQPLLEFLNMLLADAETVHSFRGRIGFDLEGFEDEKRDPEDIPELRNYLRTVSEQFPYWFWFMETRSPRLKLLLYCLCDADLRTDIGSEHVLRKYSRGSLARFMTTYGRAVEELKERVGLSAAEVAARLEQIRDYYKQQGIPL
jgi:hypothetical protein